MRQMWRHLRLVAVLLLVLSLAACGGGSSETGTAPGTDTGTGIGTSSGNDGDAAQRDASLTPADTLVMAVNSPTDHLDPAIGSSVPYWRLFLATYETLVSFDPETLELVPWLATDWVANEDATVWTFELRQGVKFHDGADFNAEAVKKSIERTLAIGQGESYLIQDVESVEVLDEFRVAFHLSRPNPDFALGLARQWIVSPKAIEENDNGDLAQEWFRRNEAGTGPYMLSEWVEGQRYVLTRFDDYWRGWDGNHVDKLEFRVVVEPGTQRLMLERGEVDVAENIPDEQLLELVDVPGIQVIRSQALTPFYIAMNTKGEPLNDVRVRKAIALAFDYQTAIEQGMLGLASPLRGPLPSRFPDFNENIPEPRRNMEEARRLLAEAGYPDGGFKLTFMYLEHWLFERTVGLVLQQNLRELGIDLELQPQPWATMVERIHDEANAPDLVMYAQSVPTPASLSMLQPMYHSSSEHWSHFMYVNPEVDRLLDQAAAATDPAERTRLIAELQEVIYEDQPQIFAFVKDNLTALRADVKGFRAHPLWDKMLNYYDMYKER